MVAYGAPLIDRLEGGASSPVCLVLCTGQRQATRTRPVLWPHLGRLRAAGRRAGRQLEPSRARRHPVRARGPILGSLRSFRDGGSRAGRRPSRRRRGGEHRSGRPPGDVPGRPSRRMPADLLRPSPRTGAALGRPPLHATGRHRAVRLVTAGHARARKGWQGAWQGAQPQGGGRGSLGSGAGAGGRAAGGAGAPPPRVRGVRGPRRRSGRLPGHSRLRFRPLPATKRCPCGCLPAKTTPRARFWTASTTPPWLRRSPARCPPARPRRPPVTAREDLPGCCPPCGNWDI